MMSLVANRIIEVSAEMEAPPDRVFELAADIPNVPNYQPAITRVEMLTPLPIGVGTRWRETRIAMGREATVELEITEFDPPRGYTVFCRFGKTDFTTRFSAAPSGSGAVGAFRMEIVPRGWWASLTSGLMAGPMRAGLADDLDTLKRAAEKVS